MCPLVDEFTARRRQKNLPRMPPKRDEECRTPGTIELTGYVVQKQEWARPAREADDIDLGKLQGKHDRAMLPLRSHPPRRMSS